MLRSKTNILAYGMALTALVGLDAVTVPNSLTLAKKTQAQRPPLGRVGLGRMGLERVDLEGVGAKQQGVANVTLPDGKHKIAAQPDTTQPPRGKIRPLPPQKQQRVYQQMAAQAKKNKKAFSAVGTPKSGFKSLRAKGIFSKKKSHFAQPKHLVKERSPLGDALTIEDGSAWSINENDRSIVQSWSENTQITFVPNSLSLWSKLLRRPCTHKYRIVNLNTKDSVQANLSLGPFVHNPHTIRIRKILKAVGEIVFSNGSVWKCDTSKASLSLLHDWKGGDFVTTGVNNTWFGLGQQEIIINVSSDNWLVAQRIM